MKVLHLIARMNVGGTARYLSMLSNGLEANGVESSIATGYVQGAEAEDPSVNSVKLHRIAHLGRAINPLNDYRAMQEFKHLVTQEKPYIIHSHTFKAGLIARIQKKSLMNAAGKEIKFIHTFHGHLLDDPEFTGLKKFFIIVLERALAKKSDKLITVGQRVADELLQEEIGNPNQYVNIPPGVVALKTIEKSAASNELGISNVKPVIGWLARVTGVKNPLLAVEVAMEIPEAQFIFGGDGDLTEQLKKIAPINAKVMGWVDAATFISACDIILSTSENEGMPVALIEAQMASKPVVGTNVGSVSEVVINDQTGLVVSKDKAALVGALRELLSDGAKLQRFGIEAAKHANANFSPSVMVQKHLDLYRLLA